MKLYFLVDRAEIKGGGGSLRVGLVIVIRRWPRNNSIGNCKQPGDESMKDHHARTRRPISSDFLTVDDGRIGVEDESEQ